MRSCPRRFYTTPPSSSLTMARAVRSLECRESHASVSFVFEVLLLDLQEGCSMPWGCMVEFYKSGESCMLTVPEKCRSMREKGDDSHNDHSPDVSESDTPQHFRFRGCFSARRNAMHGCCSSFWVYRDGRQTTAWIRQLLVFTRYRGA